MKSLTKWLFLVVTILPLSVFAQGVTTSGMRGTVIDENNEALPGATILATHLPSGSEYGTITNVDGAFNMPNMRVGGPYRVRVSFVGFETFVREGIYLTLGEPYRLNAQLRESATELETVEVVAQGGIFDNERTGVSTNINERAINVTPTVGRDLADFTRLTPQAYVENDDDDGPAISIAGQNNRYNSIFIDGAVNNDVFGLAAQGTNGGQTGSTPISIDAIEQFNIAISPFDVTQSGFTGGAINAITRSGTNQFEGSAYAFLRNESLAGKTPIDLVDSEDERESLPDFSNNRYGFRLGGPLIQNKLFFFVNGEILRSESPQPFSSTYQGDSANRLEELSNALQNADYNPGAFGDKTSKLDDNKVLVKLDWNLSRNHKLSARHSYSDSENLDAFASDSRDINFSNNSEFFPSTTNSSALELNSTFGNQYANKLVIGYTRVKDDRGFTGDPFPFVEIDDGSGTINLGSEPFSTANILDQDIFTITNNFNLFKGRHTLTIGTHNEFYSIGNLFIPQNFGQYEYGSLDDFLQSLNGNPVAPSVYQRGYSLVDNIAGDETQAIGAFDAYQLGFYIQDEFQVNDQLRLSGGIRIDVPKVTSDPNFAPDVFDTTIRDISQFYDLNGAEPGKTPAAAAYISPRFGFNYDVNGDQTLQLRGGLGVFTGRVPFVWPGSMFLNNGTNSGFVFRFGGTFPDGSPIPFVADPQNAFTGSDFGQSDIPSGRLEIFEEDFRYPRVFRTSLGLDYQLPNGWLATLEGQYTNTLSGVLVTNVNLNPNTIVNLDGPEGREVYFGDVAIDPRYSAVHRVGNTDEGYTYDVTARVQKQARFGENDLFFNLAYTYGDSQVINDGTSSQINTLWRSMENVNGANNLELTRSDFAIGSRVIAGLTYRAQYINNLATTFSLYYAGETGRPFSYTIDNSGGMAGAPGGRDFSLVFIPNSGSDFTWDGDAAQQAADFDTYVNSSNYLSGLRGEYVDRNGSRLPFEHIFDLKLSQELSANFAGRSNTLEVTLDIFNVGNLLNKNWGKRYGKFTSSSNGGFHLLDFRGFVDPENGDFTPIYRLDFNPDNISTEQEMFDDQILDAGTFSSRWLMQFGVRYSF